MVSQEEVWDREYSLNSTKWYKETVDLPSFPSGARVLELGAGNGKTLKSVLKKSIGSVVALDFSSESISRLKNEFSDSNVNFIKADVCDLPFEDSSFDVVVCYFVLNNLLSKERKLAVNEIRRVLGDGGSVFFKDFGVGDMREKKDLLFNEDHTIKNGSGVICHFFSVSELEGLFSDFSNSEFSVSEFNPIKKDPELKRVRIKGIVKK